jgi:hypothetical protein
MIFAIKSPVLGFLYWRGRFKISVNGIRATITAIYLRFDFSDLTHKKLIIVKEITCSTFPVSSPPETFVNGIMEPNMRTSVESIAKYHISNFMAPQSPLFIE